METDFAVDNATVLISLSSLLLGRALQETLSREPAIRTVVAGYHQLSDALQPDHILVDAYSLERNHQASWPDAKLILIDTGLPEDEIITLLLNHKFFGIISTNTPPELFIQALQAIHHGRIWIDNDKLKALLHNSLSHLKPPSRDHLSRKEQDIVAHIAQGLKNREIAAKLCISEQTVKTHISRIFKKVNVTSRSQLVPLALKLKL